MPPNAACARPSPRNARAALDDEDADHRAHGGDGKPGEQRALHEFERERLADEVHHSSSR
jgi:hypothetical protein